MEFWVWELEIFLLFQGRFSLMEVRLSISFQDCQKQESSPWAFLRGQDHQNRLQYTQR